MNKIWVVVLSGFFLFACTKDDLVVEKDIHAYREYASFADFKNALSLATELEDELTRDLKIGNLWNSLKGHHQIPFVMNDTVAFLYKGDANQVNWAGDFNGWNPQYSGFQGQKLGLSNVWMVQAVFPHDARLDYKIVKDGAWILDPANSFIQYSGFGPNSELRMPGWVFPQETVLADGVSRGTLSGNHLIFSSVQNLSYDVQYKVYTPFGYESLENLPVIFVTDGHEYAGDDYGAMVIVLDNLIHSGIIRPVIAVFIDPRQPSNTSINRRETEYRSNIRFANFVADELVHVIDSAFKTDTSPRHRAIIGTSYGGWNSAYFGLVRHDKFQLIAMHSPAFDGSILNAYNDSSLLPLKIFMSTGVIFDTQAGASTLKQILDAKGYPNLYKEVNEGHSWGNWRALMDEPLIYFFGNKK